MLDFTQIITQIQSFTSERVRAQPQEQAALAEARHRLCASGPTWETTQDKIAQSRTSWLVAEWLEPPDRTHSAPERPLPCIVYAADGSQIVADRHDIALCYLLNVGLITLRYGTGERARLTSRPSLNLPDDDLLDETEGDQNAIVPRRLNLRRQLAEFAGLAELIAEGALGVGRWALGVGEEQEKAQLPNYPTTQLPYHPTPPALALFDGSLILWPLEKETEEFRAESLREFEAYLETARQSGVPLAGYISQSQSRDVVNALRVFQCPFEKVNCDQHCPHRQKPKPLFVAPPCAGTERVTDAELFTALLTPGERSAVFGSSSQILSQYAPEHTIRFFYLNTGREIARVEIPAWVADTPELLAQTHALCYDQACKGDGYPVALAEAHEQAIVRGAEREAFFHLMEREFVTAHLPVAATQKSVSKRARRV